ncbi:hypothetical protein Achl_4339 (plasmid) [Pseudarthrobacter chlorophenolicus A6]|uniref:Uncharacterized protein n=1 Tax=Pseudarthrobacter chlorophenolicus (strain ATCC 700700 / DSM 12829 / CIP 107037 / JCM 12360 / KCTC 9906 / NCIMB 13794 / A6) TaxID=452863 RepID=B8HIP3_PSECP|nr:hypothetical protein [Pseudarthrobacter chlorophenolicus]ACL42290.1 hypothetical protein Achl_4339 [Pseudarthrobacter chlorophenolicus A6]SDQ16078.1 hypothetical protein SAMN04489738_0397 [Pseudarthrobacter chlorophenolicus]
MAHPQFTVETVGGSTQATIEGLMQLTILEDGSVQINLAGKHVEVERSGLQYIVRPEADSAQFGAEMAIPA